MVFLGGYTDLRSWGQYLNFLFSASCPAFVLGISVEPF